MNKLFVKIVLLILCLVLAIGCFGGCKPNHKDVVSSDPSSTQNTADDPSDTDQTSSEPTDEPIAPEDDTWDDPQGTVEPDDSESEEENFSSAVVENAQLPIMDDYRGFGSIVYQMYTYMPYANKKNEFTEKQAQEQFNRMQEIGIDYIRSDYNTYMAYDAKTGGFDYENTDYIKAFYKEALELKKRNIEIAVTTGWSLHALTDNSSSINSIHVYVEGDWQQTLSNWNRWMVDSILAFRAHGCTNITGMLLFTEPGKVGWEESYRLANYEAWVDCARTLDQSLKQLGIRKQYQFIGPNQSVYGDFGVATDDMLMLEYMLKNADEYIDVYTSHDYVKAKSAVDDVYYDYCELLYRNSFLSTMEQYGSDKPFWVDEWNVAESGFTQSHHDSPWLGTQLGVCATAFMEFGIQNSILWTLYSQQWPNLTHSGGEFTEGIQMCGLAYSLNISTIPTTQYYGYTLLSKYLATTDTVYHVEYDRYLGVYYAYAENGAGDITVIVVNAYPDTSKFSLEFEKSLGGVTLYRHLYDPTTCKPNSFVQVLPADRAYRPVQDKLVDILPAGGLAVYTTVK